MLSPDHEPDNLQQPDDVQKQRATLERMFASKAYVDLQPDIEEWGVIIDEAKNMLEAAAPEHRSAFLQQYFLSLRGKLYALTHKFEVLASIDMFGVGLSRRITELLHLLLLMPGEPYAAQFIAAMHITPRNFRDLLAGTNDKHPDTMLKFATPELHYQVGAFLERAASGRALPESLRYAASIHANLSIMKASDKLRSSSSDAAPIHYLIMRSLLLSYRVTFTTGHEDREMRLRSLRQILEKVDILLERGASELPEVTKPHWYDRFAIIIRKKLEAARLIHPVPVPEPEVLPEFHLYRDKACNMLLALDVLTADDNAQIFAAACDDIYDLIEKATAHLSSGDLDVDMPGA